MKEHHYILNKPYNCLSQFIYEQKRKNSKNLLGELHDFAKGTMAIGRLDEKSEGLLLLTTNGMVSHHIRSKKVEKEYYAQVDGVITEEAVEKMKRGVEIGFNGTKYTTKPCEASILYKNPDLPIAIRKVRDERHGPKSWVCITLTEGKFRQVRKMTAAVGFPTLRLVRVRIDTIRLTTPPGEVIEVSSFYKTD